MYQKLHIPRIFCLIFDDTSCYDQMGRTESKLFSVCLSCRSPIRLYSSLFVSLDIFGSEIIYEFDFSRISEP